jgi:alkylation response protein AidB-like acyl-CoA dehydrogenase
MVSFVPTAEQDALQRVLRDFAEHRSPEAAVRRDMESERGYDVDLWREMTAPMGLAGILVPEDEGGAGFSFRELGLVMEELGRALVCAPFFSTVVLATNLLLLIDDDNAARRRWLPAIAAGGATATVAVSERLAEWTLDDIRTAAVPDGEGWRLEGCKPYVVDGHTSDVVFVAARTGAGVGLFEVQANASGLRRTPLSTMDQTRRLARLEFEGAAANSVGRQGSASLVLEQLQDRAAIALAAEQVGAAQRCLDMAVEYARLRVQFGRPIGSYQAIKHKLADMHTQIEQARSATLYACGRVADGASGSELRVLSSMARAYCSEAFLQASMDTIQVHGGIGFTWDHPAHLYLKRAKADQILLGDPIIHRQRLADALGL